MVKNWVVKVASGTVTAKLVQSNTARIVIGKSHKPGPKKRRTSKKYADL